MFGFSLAVVALMAAGCAEATPEAAAPSAADRAALLARVALVDQAVEAWATASSIEDAHLHAETALNLVVGPNGPGYGDRDSDGEVAGANESGMLPGADATPVGLAMPLVSDTCVRRDVLGSDWSEPRQEWDALKVAIEAWEPGNNTMPSLPSHPMRVVGWATFTLNTDSLDLAHEFAFHAGIHVDISRRALDC